MILVVDDLRLFGDNYKNVPILHAINSKQAIEILDTMFPFIIEFWLDHDLGMVAGEIDSIYPVLNWLEEKGFNGESFDKKIRILTSNPVGFQKIKALSRYYEILSTPNHLGIREEVI